MILEYRNTKLEMPFQYLSIYHNTEMYDTPKKSLQRINFIVKFDFLGWRSQNLN